MSRGARGSAGAEASTCRERGRSSLGKKGAAVEEALAGVICVALVSGGEEGGVRGTAANAFRRFLGLGRRIAAALASCEPA